jgi:hypothetical protein
MIDTVARPDRSAAASGTTTRRWGRRQDTAPATGPRGQDVPAPPGGEPAPGGQLPDELAADHTGTADPAAAPPRGQRRAQTKVQRHLLREIERRNRKQLLPHYLTGGLLALGHVIHELAAQASAVGTAALLTGLAVAGAGAAATLLLRRRRILLQGWLAWSALLATATATWMVVTVVAGLTWPGLAAALAADYAFGARWWARHRHPAAVEPTAADPAAETEVITVDPSRIAHYPRRWAEFLGCTGGLLAGAQLVDGRPFEHGLEYTLRLHPGKHDLDLVLSCMSKIATGLGHPMAQLVAEEFNEDSPELVTFRVVTQSPVKADVFFTGPQFIDGKVVLGPYADGIGEALWRIYSDDSIWGGMVIGGTGSGKSRLLEVIGLSAMDAHRIGLPTYVIHVDGQDGASCPQLWKHANERYGSWEVEQVLERITAMQKYRQRNRQSEDPGFTPTLERPGILVIVDEAHVVITKENAEEWAAIAREARKVGIGVVMGDQDGSLETFKKTVLRGSLRAGNAVGLKTDERTQGQIVANGKFNLADLPAIPGFGHTLGVGARHAPYKGKWAPARKNALERAAAGRPFPDGLLLIEDWYERVAQDKIQLDLGTSTAITTHGADKATAGGATSLGPVRPGNVRLTAAVLPTVRVPALANPVLTESQRGVLTAVRSGLNQPGVIAEEVGLTRQAVGSILATLGAKGLVTKTGAGKAVNYEVTALGKAA